MCRDRSSLIVLIGTAGSFDGKQFAPASFQPQCHAARSPLASRAATAYPLTVNEADWLRKGLIMSRQTIVLLTASMIVGITSLAATSTGALAAKKAVHHRAPAAAPAAPVAAAPVAVIDNNYGPVADGIPKCFDSVIFYPVPPCY
jgi:hypothetical protein